MASTVTCNSLECAISSSASSTAEIRLFISPFSQKAQNCIWLLNAVRASLVSVLNELGKPIRRKSNAANMTPRWPKDYRFVIGLQPCERAR
jgi:hypothetical protein